MDTLTIVLVPLLALAAPLIAAAIGRVVLVPLVVFEIVLGIIFGPAVLDLIKPGEFILTLSEIGLAMLFFVAGSEINFAEIKGRPLATASAGWLISIVAGVLLGVFLAPDPTAGVFIGIALASTALGTILPVLRDAGELPTPFGKAVVAIGAVGEFGPLLAISLFLGGRSFGLSTIVVVIFALVAGAAIWIAAKGHHQRLHRLVSATLHTSGQVAIRLIVFVLAVLVGLSVFLGLDMLLGAFAAGVLWRVLSATASEADRKNVESKIEALAFGFLVPVFFIITGVTFDVAALIAEPGLLLLIPVFVLAFLVLRGLPGLLSAPPGSSASDKRAVVLFSATALPIIVAVTNLALDDKAISTGLAAALVAAGMVSVLLFPALALGQRKSARTARATLGQSEG